LKLYAEKEDGVDIARRDRHVGEVVTVAVEQIEIAIVLAGPGQPGVQRSIELRAHNGSRRGSAFRAAVACIPGFLRL
jgi:hypothetical protein